MWPHPPVYELLTCVQGRLKEARAALERLRGHAYQCEEELLYLERSDAVVPSQRINLR